MVGAEGHRRGVRERLCVIYASVFTREEAAIAEPSSSSSSSSSTSIVNFGEIRDKLCEARYTRDESRSETVKVNIDCGIDYDEARVKKRANKGVGSRVDRQ